jgi:hypothetical protein
MPPSVYLVRMYRDDTPRPIWEVPDDVVVSVAQQVLEDGVG